MTLVMGTSEGGHLARIYARLTDGATSFRTRVEGRSNLLRRRARDGGNAGHWAQAEEDVPPVGQAAAWYEDVIQYVPMTGQYVARQIARLCGDDSVVTVPIRSLTDAVGLRDSKGRTRAPTERGVEVLIKAGWLRVEVVGSSKRLTRTTYYLLPGPRVDWVEGADWEDAQVSA